MHYRGEEKILGQKSRLFHGEKITVMQTSGNHYYINYKGREIDIGNYNMNTGLLAALEWFGNIIRKEVGHGKTNDS
jgi:hypothetical protein